MPDRPDPKTLPVAPGGTVRRPQRRRGRDRFALLLDATERLLARHPDRDLSLSMIADEARVPLPSVYHFFPNRNAILVALAERFHADLGAMARTPMDPGPGRWQDIVAHRQTSGAAYLNAHPAALRLFLGAGVSVEVRNLDLRGNASLAATRGAEFRHWFDCSAMSGLEHWLAITIGLMDGIWAISWTEHRQITPPFLAESIAATTAYLRLHLPESLPVRSQASR